MRCLLLYAAATLGLAYAAPVNLQISLANPTLTAKPGITVDWVATLSDPVDLAAGDSIVITGSSFDVPCQGCAGPPASRGIYTDSIGAGFVVLAPAGNCCGDPQTAPDETIGSFAIAPTSPFGPIAGFLEIDYSIFSADPNDPNFNPDTDTLVPDARAFAPVAVNVAPEPGSLWLASLAAGILLAARWRLRLSNYRP